MTKTIRINPDDRTILTGYFARVVGPVASAWTSPGSRGFWQGWTGPDQGFDWTINVPRAGRYAIDVLAEGGPQRPTVEVTAAGKTFPVRLGPYWDRISAGEVALPAGRSTISLRSTGETQPLKFISLELVRPGVARRIETDAMSLRADTSWMVDKTYGLMFHWVGGTYPRRGPSKPYRQAVNDFPVKKFADTVASMGAGWVYVCTTHAIYHWPGPNSAIDAILRGRTCKRDLIGELAQALTDRGVRLGLYYHPGHDDKPWWNRVGFDTAGRETFFRTWKRVIEDAGRRYGELLAGWWFDDGMHSYYHAAPPWKDLLIAARAGNPQRVVLWNAWLAPKVTWYTDTSSWESWLTSDLISGGGNLPVGGDGRFIAGPQKGLQAHLTTLIHQSWGHHKPNTPISKCQYTTEQLIKWLQEVRSRKAVVSLNLEIYQDGKLGPADIRRFRQIRAALDKSHRGS
ncbi:MAG: alpha-L-fucosidase [Planctomycetaceae bacterium]|nr:alpha-L-fucosidase [Planctomycetaceae bacterium]